MTASTRCRHTHTVNDVMACEAKPSVSVFVFGVERALAPNLMTDAQSEKRNFRIIDTLEKVSCVQKTSLIQNDPLCSSHSLRNIRSEVPKSVRLCVCIG